MVTTEQIKDLRERTGLSIMQCKKALEDADGDIEKARIVLQKKGVEIASKKSERRLGSGTVASYIHATGTVGAMVELFCETDFVSKNDEFKEIARDIAMHVAATNPKYLKKEDVTDEERKKVTLVFEKELEGVPSHASKTEELKQKIMQGKLDAYFGEQSLLDQPFIKNPEMKIIDLVNSAVQKFGEKTEVGRFVRFSTTE